MFSGKIWYFDLNTNNLFETLNSQFTFVYVTYLYVVREIDLRHSKLLICLSKTILKLSEIILKFVDYETEEILTRFYEISF